MDYKELKKYIERVLGNSFRCLLPSYWWKRIFGLVIDKVSELDTKVKALKPDSSMSDTSSNSVQNKVIKKYVDSVSNIPVRTTYYWSSEKLSPNIYYVVSGTPSSVNLYLETPTNNTILNNYMIEFTTPGLSEFTLYADADIKWANGEVPVFEPGKTYQISIINKLAVISNFE